MKIVVLKKPESNVTELRTTTPLFKAYEEVYSNLEAKMCPLFYKSEEVSIDTCFSNFDVPLRVYLTN